MFDEQFNYISSSSGAEQVPDEGVFAGKVHKHIKTDLPVDKNGYLYVYVSNVSPNYPVYFDNLQVTHYRGVLFEETHYYPFCLVMAGISSKAAGITENKLKYNGKEEQRQEFSDGSGLSLYDYRYRMQDPQIGKMWQIDPLAVQYPRESPYCYAGNNPISNVDVDGLFQISKETEKFLKQNYPKAYKFLTSKDGIAKFASNPKLLSAFEKLGFGKNDVVRDYTPGSEAEIRVTDKDNFYRGETPWSESGRVININAKILDILESTTTPEELEAGMLAVAEVLTHEDAHRASLLLGEKELGDKFDNPNNYTGDEDGFWLSEQIWGNLNGYYNFQAPATSDPNFVQSLLNAAMLMLQSQQQQEQAPPDKPLERF